jgi:Mrp family chromosome partitioning ATPase/capsular polysaccharide biosynthesis protein
MQDLAAASKRNDGFRPARPEASGEFIRHRDFARFFKRAFPTMMASVLAALTIAAAYIFVATPVYTARAQLLIDPKVSQAIREQVAEVNFSLDNAQVESHIAVVRSEQIAMLVIKKLKLLEDQEFQVPAAQERSSDKDRSPGSENPATLRIAILKFLANLDVRRSGLSYVIDISFSSRDPEKAARIANGIAQAYVDDQLETRQRAAREGSEWLEERINQLRRQMNGAARQVQEFKAGHDYRLVRKRPGEATDSTFNLGTGSAGAPGVPSATRPNVVVREDITLEELESTALTYRKIYELFLQAYAEAVQRQSYPVANARLITEAMRPTSKSRPQPALALLLGALVGSLVGCGIALIQQGQVGEVLSRDQILAHTQLACLSQVPDFDMTSATPAMRAQRVLSLLRASKSGARTAAPETWVPVPIAAADGMQTKYPNLARMMQQSDGPHTDATKAGALDADAPATSVYANEQSAATTGDIPDADARSSDGGVAPAWTASQSIGQSIGQTIVPPRAVVTSPHSSFSSGIRDLRLSLGAFRATGHGACIGLMSIRAGSGTTSILMNLATLYAVAGTRVLVVDANTYNPTLSAVLQPDAQHGLLQVVAGAEMTGAIAVNDAGGPDVLPLGSMADGVHDPLWGGQLARLIEPLRATYDLILIDLPPMKLLLDVHVLADLVDRLVVVANSRTTPLRLLSEAADSLTAAESPVCGVVLNRVDADAVAHPAETPGYSASQAWQRPAA